MSFLVVLDSQNYCQISSVTYKPLDIFGGYVKLTYTLTQPTDDQHRGTFKVNIIRLAQKGINTNVSIRQQHTLPPLLLKCKE